ncbi:ABC transporter substrate-binding protein [Erwinia typographi]|uniref:ABC transporter substrate-binding protein n=1 Tax=Erwinia typographi TaxID=371042 RepID=A0A0A3YR83_9GAMM|nr:substrate-binding domain-containing protein [Erwinia typographi]KGT89140.1 ABC transporter substrate-binding protein [Erwinia typographi]
MRIPYRLTCYALALTSLFAGTARAADECLVGISMFTLGAPYYSAALEAASKKAKEMGCKITTADGQNDMSKQISDVEDMVARGVNALVIDPRDPEGLVTAVNAASAAGIKVVVFDSALNPRANYVTLVQSSNDQNGRLIGSWLAKKMKGQAMKIALISGSKGNVVGEERRLGVIRGLTEAQLQQSSTAGFQIVGQGWGDWTQEGGLKAMEDLLVAHPDINVVFGENDSMVLGARMALEQAGKADKVTLVAASDGQKEAYRLIKEGKYGVTGLNDPDQTGTLAAQYAIEALRGKLPADFPKVYYTKPAAVTKENVDQFYKPNSIF